MEVFEELKLPQPTRGRWLILMDAEKQIETFLVG